jgi:hypothetical protein
LNVRAIAHGFKESSAPGFRNRAIRNHHEEHERMEANAAAMNSLFSSYTWYMCFRKSQASSKRQREALELKRIKWVLFPLFLHFEFSFGQKSNVIFLKQNVTRNTAIYDSDLSKTEKLNKRIPIDAAVLAGLTYSAGCAGKKNSRQTSRTGPSFR